MNILLTNDDGVESEGILLLAQALRSKNRYDVFVLAPDKNRSGVSCGLSIFEPQMLSKKSEGIWTCTGLPVDCVIAAVLGGIPCKPDVVVSGINRGANMGNDIHYSGTVAAARQGTLMGIPSVAVSLDAFSGMCWKMAAEYAADHMDDFIDMWENDILINVNIPNNPAGPDGMVFTWPGTKNYNDTLSVFRGPWNKDWCYLVPGEETHEEQKGTDLDAVSRNLVSVSPLVIRPVIRRDFCTAVPDCAAAGRQGD